MKAILMAAVAASVLAVAGTAMAGGPGCDSKKKGDQQALSPEALQEFKNSHGWVHPRGDKPAAQSGGAMMTPAAGAVPAVIRI